MNRVGTFPSSQKEHVFFFKYVLSQTTNMKLLRAFDVFAVIYRLPVRCAAGYVNTASSQRTAVRLLSLYSTVITAVRLLSLYSTVITENSRLTYCAVVKPQTQAPGLGPRLLLVKPVYPPSTHLYFSTFPETGPNFTLFVSFEPSTRYSWAGQCRAAVLILHIFSYYICSRFCTIESVISTYVIQEWTTFWCILRFCEQKGTLCTLQFDFC